MRYPARQIIKAALLFATLVISSYTFLRYIFSPPTPQFINVQDFDHSKTEQIDSIEALSPEQANHLCAKYGWNVFRPHSPQKLPRKVYDLFLINTELDWLEIRLNELSPYVDYFVVVEASTTFTYLPKPLHLKENWDHFKPWHHKMIHHVVEGTGPDALTAWDHETWQRNSMLTQVFPRLVEEGGPKSPEIGDVLVVSDLDEIPRPETLMLLRSCHFPRRTNIRSRFYYYSWQWLHRGPDWEHPQATFYDGAGTLPPHDLRMNYAGSGLFTNILRRLTPVADLWNASWHCSSCFNSIAEMQTKIASFSHMAFNIPEFTDPEKLVSRVRNGQDLFARPDQIYDRTDDNSDAPRYLFENKQRFEYLLNRDPENANFGDYFPPAPQQ
ncbi:hypothetical protein KEM56_001905 [Ascosphaera pollenicola]|nr:hypothetical protein KEM56_001905 [Ascosphaera pollenicola]